MSTRGLAPEIWSPSECSGVICPTTPHYWIELPLIPPSNRSAFTFLAADAPYYHTGYSICLGMVCLGAVSAVVYGFLLTMQNKRHSALGEKGGVKYFSL